MMIVRFVRFQYDGIYIYPAFPTSKFNLVFVECRSLTWYLHVFAEMRCLTNKCNVSPFHPLLIVAILRNANTAHKCACF